MPAKVRRADANTTRPDPAREAVAQLGRQLSKLEHMAVLLDRDYESLLRRHMRMAIKFRPTP